MVIYHAFRPQRRRSDFHRNEDGRQLIEVKIVDSLGSASRIPGPSSTKLLESGILHRRCEPPHCKVEGLNPQRGKVFSDPPPLPTNPGDNPLAGQGISSERRQVRMDIATMTIRLRGRARYRNIHRGHFHFRASWRKSFCDLLDGNLSADKVTGVSSSSDRSTRCDASPDPARGSGDPGDSNPFLQTACSSYSTCFRPHETHLF